MHFVILHHDLKIQDLTIKISFKREVDLFGEEIPIKVAD